MDLKVGFSKPKAKWKILSPLICWVQKWNAASHTYLVLWDDATQQEIVFQAAFPRVCLMTKKEFLQDNEVFEEIPINMKDKVNTTDYMFMEEYVWNMIYSTLNKPYSIIQLFLILWKLATGRNYKMRRPDAAYICTEIIGKLFVDMGLCSIEEIQTKTVKDIYVLCKYMHRLRRNRE